jgi:hypothetical protein
MKSTTALSAIFLAMAMSGWIHIAQADSLEANCEVRKDGDKQKGRSGPCTFGQRQGYIDIDLRNGDTMSLSPTNQANHFKDQKGNKVVRTGAGGNTQEYKWEGGTRVIVTFPTSPSYGGASAAGYGAGNGSSEYQRGYNDAIRGRQFDQNRHPQDYKDGFRAGEDARGGHNSSGYGNGNSGHGDYSINRMSNGGFEVVWEKVGCIASFNSRGEAMSFSDKCNDDLNARSREIAKRER